jgi:hypothetical protein
MARLWLPGLQIIPVSGRLPVQTYLPVDRDAPETPDMHAATLGVVGYPWPEQLRPDWPSGDPRNLCRPISLPLIGEQVAQASQTPCGQAARALLLPAPAQPQAGQTTGRSARCQANIPAWQPLSKRPTWSASSLPGRSGVEVVRAVPLQDGPSLFRASGIPHDHQCRSVTDTLMVVACLGLGQTVVEQVA